MEERFHAFTVLVSNLNRCISRIKTEEMAEYNLKGSHVSCIYYIYRYGNLKLKELCDLSGEDKSNISRSLKFLEDNGYLVVDFHKSKKYQRPIELTELGNKVGEEISNKINKVLSYASVGLSEDDRNIMYQGLNLINDRLNKLCWNYINKSNLL